MQDIENVLAKARALGEALAANETVRAYRSAQHAVQNDDAAQQLLQGYQQQATHIQRLEAEGKPVEVDDKTKLRDCETRMSANEALKNLMRLHADYVYLMNEVNRNMEAPLSASQQEGEPK
jgi:cell fate (sporulation/competence/biofilm development) regulator YlbF (YheA/YmcA/DUF963 family)